MDDNEVLVHCDSQDNREQRPDPFPTKMILFFMNRVATMNWS